MHMLPSCRMKAHCCCRLLLRLLILLITADYCWLLWMLWITVACCCVAVQLIPTDSGCLLRLPPPTLAMAHPPTQANILCNRSLCYLKLEESGAALEDAKSAIAAVPELPKGHYRAAQALSASGRVREARFKLAEVIKYSKHNKNADAEKLLAELDGKVVVSATPLYVALW